MYGPPGYLRNPHAIAITVKAVPGIDGVAIRSENEFAPRERADENEQRGLRQMEIRQQLIDHAKRVPRLDENSRFRRSLLASRSVPGLRCCSRMQLIHTNILE